MTDLRSAPTSPVCPYLGLKQDRDSRYGFPTDGNHCHREGAPRAIQLDYQQDICLGGRYQQCPIYLQPGPAAAAPAPDPTPRRSSRRLWLIVILVLLIALCGLFFAAQGAFGSLFWNSDVTATETPEEELPDPVLLPSLTPLPIQEATLPPTELPAPTSAATATETPSETPTATETATQPPTATATTVPPTGTPAPTETPTEPPPSPTPETQKPTDTPEP